MTRVVILTTNDFCTDRRVMKVASVFRQLNFELILLGRLTHNSQPLQLDAQVKRFRMLFHHSFLFYAEYNVRAFFYLLFASYSHILSNDTDTLPAAFLVSKLRRKKLLFDAHELFPEVPELHNRKFVKNCWHGIEQFIFPQLKFSYTVSRSIAQHYNRKYGMQMQVVRNMPELQMHEKGINNFGSEKIILYQGALNKGRGLEWIIDAMPFVDKAMLLIIGTGDIEKQLHERVLLNGTADKVKFLGRIDGNELTKYTALASVGLCMLEPLGLSYQYALPNRIFDYLHANVPVIATDFNEIRAIVDTYKTGVLINTQDPKQIALAVNKILNEGFDTSHFATVAQQLCWENESKKLIEIIRKTL